MNHTAVVHRSSSGEQTPTSTSLRSLLQAFEMGVLFITLYSRRAEHSFLFISASSRQHLRQKQ